jgi:hypothetical protein
MSPSPRRSAPARPRGPRFRRSLTAAGVLALGAAGVAQPSPSAPAAEEPDSVNRSEPSFSAADLNRWQTLRAANARLVLLAERARRFTPTPDVLVLAHQLQVDHARLAGEMERLAPAAAAPTTGRPPPLEGSVSEEFDRAFLNEVAAESEALLALCADVVQNAEAPVLRAFATDAVVTLDRNLHRVRDLQQPPGGSAN